MGTAKKIFTTIFVLLGLAGITTSMAFLIKSPGSFVDLGREIGIVNDGKNESGTQKLPYFMDFTNLSGTGSGYKSSYLNSNNSKAKWYCSWGTEPTKSKEDVEVSYILGWNNIENIYYGGYTYKDEIQKIVSETALSDGYKFSYIIMDFDFIDHHEIEFNVKAFDNLSKDTTLQLITSNNQGKSWSIVKDCELENINKGIAFKINHTYKPIGNINRRYGLLLSSKNAYCRLEMYSFSALGI